MSRIEKTRTWHPNRRKIQLNSDTQLRQHWEGRDGSQIGRRSLEVYVDEGAISSGTLYRNSTHISEVSTGNTEQDSNTGELYEEDGDSVISSETLYNEGIHTSGEDRNDTGPNNSTLLHDPFNYRDGISASDTAYSIGTPGKETYNSDKDTGYGESKDSDNEERHGSLENASGKHNWETENFP